MYTARKNERSCSLCSEQTASFPSTLAVLNSLLFHFISFDYILFYSIPFRLVFDFPPLGTFEDTSIQSGRLEHEVGTIEPKHQTDPDDGSR